MKKKPTLSCLTTRPSLWVIRGSNAPRIFYPNGRIEFYIRDIEFNDGVPKKGKWADAYIDSAAFIKLKNIRFISWL